MEDLNFNQNYPFEEYPSAYQNLNAQRAHAKTTCTDCAYNTLEKAKFNVECYYGTYTGDNIPYVYDWQYNDAWTKETPIRKTCAIRFYNRYKDKMTQFPETREMHDFDSFSPIQMSGELQVKKLFWDISNTYINGWWGTSYYNQIMASILWDCGAAMDGVITYTITE
jgi:hypothetical protein